MSHIPQGSGAEVIIENLTKQYQSRRGPIEALQAVSLKVRRGEFVSLLGPSGCGKSTLLMIVAGLIESSEGTVTIDRVPVDTPQTQVGVAFQDAVLLDWRTALGNVLLQIEARGLPMSEYRPRAVDLLKSVGLDGFEGSPPYELSGGMKQRVAICRALVHDPPLLLMDEPFGALDALTRDQMAVDLQSLWSASAKTVLFVTHSIPEAVFLSDRVVVMTPRPGRVDAIVEVDLPRPRYLRERGSAKFAEYVERITQLFEARGVLQEGARARKLTS